MTVGELIEALRGVPHALEVRLEVSFENLSGETRDEAVEATEIRIDVDTPVFYIQG